MGMRRYGRGRLILTIMRYYGTRLSMAWQAMPLGRKLFAAFFGALLLFFVPFGFLTRYIIENALLHQKRLGLYQAAQAARSMLEYDLNNQLTNTKAFAWWTECQQAVLKRDEEWLRDNVIDWCREFNGYESVVIFSSQGKRLFHDGVYTSGMSENPLLERAKRGEAGSGLLREGNAIYQVSYTPIMDNAGKPPQAGVLMFAQAIDEQGVAQLWSQISNQVVLLTAAPGEFSNTLPQLREGEHQEVALQMPLTDAHGHVVGVLEARPSIETARAVRAAADRAHRYFLVLSVLMSLFVVWVVASLIRRNLKMFVHASHQLASHLWSVRVPYAARDEFGELARAFNRMANDLQVSFDRLNHQHQEIEHQKTELEALYNELQNAHASLETSNEDLQEANRRLEEAAFTDGLTGLLNHRAFQDQLRKEAMQAQRSGQPLSLILLDIDYFKNFNDTFGHPAGDELLKLTADALRDTARAYDLVARYGGEEFAILLPNTDMQEALRVADRIRENIAAIENDYMPVTASLGVATARETIIPANLVYRADQALYAAKRAGRNQVQEAA